MSTHIECESRNTYELRDGDVVQSEGSRFLVHGFVMRDDGARWCRPLYLGPVSTPDMEHIRRAFGEAELHRWVIQGNDKALWAVEVVN